MTSEQLAELFHTTYEALAPQYSYQTRKASAVPWESVPDNNKNLMIAVAREVLHTIQLDELHALIRDFEAYLMSLGDRAMDGQKARSLRERTQAMVGQQEEDATKGLLDYVNQSIAKLHKSVDKDAIVERVENQRRPRWYILDQQDHPVSVDSIEKRIAWYLANPGCCDKQIQVGQTEVEKNGSIVVSTIFTGVDLHWLYADVEKHPVQLYETLVVRLDQREGGTLFDRYATREDALEGHETAVRMLQQEGF